MHEKNFVKFVFLLALLVRLVPGPRTIDDSFITFRYASNILAGNGFTYNPGEQVLGTTTPLYTFLLTGLGALAGGSQAPFAHLAMGLNALADAGTVLLLIGLGRRLGSRRAGWGAALAWAIAPFSVTFAIGGLETSVYVLLLTGIVSAYLHNRRLAAAWLAALALLTRPDALILLGPLGLDWLIQTVRGRSSWREFGQAAAVFLLPTAAWFLFATLYFGSPLPHSIAAKSLAYRLPPDAAFVRLLQHYTTPFLDHLTLGRVGIGLGLLLYPFLSLLGTRHALRCTPRAWPFLAYPWLYFATFALANPLIFRWYLTPPLPAFFLVILTGADRLLSDLLRLEPKTPHSERIRPNPEAIHPNRAITQPHPETTQPDPETVLSKPSRPTQRLTTGWAKAASGLVTALILLLPAGLSLRGWTLHPDHGLTRPAPEMAWYQLELLYRQAAGILAAEIDPGHSPAPLLAAGDVGVLGFFSGARILDTVGLNSPQSLRYYPLDPALYTINYAIPPDLILDEQPDYIVILEVYGREGLLKDPRFWESYRLKQKIPTDIYGSDGMLIFTRQ